MVVFCKSDKKGNVNELLKIFRTNINEIVPIVIFINNVTAVEKKALKKAPGTHSKNFGVNTLK